MSELLFETKTFKDELKELGYDPKFKEKAAVNIISPYEYYMSLACLTALRSIDPQKKVGACIINENKRIVGLGCNNFPERYGYETKKFELPLNRGDEKLNNKTSKSYSLNTKYPYICHSACSAILNKNTSNLRNCVLYSTTLPCNECFKLIIQSGITSVVYIEDGKNKWSSEMRESINGSKVMALHCNIELEHWESYKNIKMHEIVFKPENIDVKSLKLENTSSIDFSVPKNLIDLGFNPNYSLMPKNYDEQLKLEDYFMCIAIITSWRSKDPFTQVGACIVDSRDRVVSCGYNGFPSKIDNLPWDSDDDDRKTVNSKKMYECHAELNVIVNKHEADINGCTLYVTLFPCCDCAKLIVQSQLKKVIYLEDRDDDAYRASKVMFEKYNIEYSQFKANRNSIDFLSIFDKSSDDDDDAEKSTLKY